MPQPAPRVRYVSVAPERPSRRELWMTVVAGTIATIGLLGTTVFHLRGPGPAYRDVLAGLCAATVGACVTNVLRFWQTEKRATLFGLLRLACFATGCFAGLMLSFATTSYPKGNLSEVFQVKTSTPATNNRSNGKTVSVTPLYMRCMQDCSDFASNELEISTGTGLFSRFRYVRLPIGVYWNGQHSRTDVLVLRGPNCIGITRLEGLPVHCSAEN